MSSRVLLCEPDSALARILIKFFASERIGVTECASVQEIETALIDHPGAVVVADYWADGRHGELTVRQRDAINRWGQRITVVITTARSWAQNASGLHLGPLVSVIPKPYDLEELLEVVRAGSQPTLV
jgi:DNA-binding NtrC family response regulator